MSTQFQDVINVMCGGLPDGWEIQLYMESGSALVQLVHRSGLHVDLPNTLDGPIEERLYEALGVAVSFAQDSNRRIWDERLEYQDRQINYERVE